MKRVIPVLNYSTFYVGFKPQEDPLEMLSGYDVEIVILTLVGIRNSLDKNKNLHAKDGAIESIIASLPPEKAKRLWQFMHSEHKFSLVQSPVIDKILVDIFPKLNHNIITRDLNDGQFEQRILDVLLTYNETFYDNDILDKYDVGHELMWSLVMMQGVSRVSKVDFARTGLIKHLLMLEFLDNSLGEDVIAIQKSFRASTGMMNIGNIISWFKHLFQFLESEDGKVAFLPRLDIKDPMLAYLEPMDLLINKRIAADDKFDIGMMLSRPFFETSSGAVFILDHQNFSFLAERAFMFLLYHKSDFPKLAKIKDINGLYSYFGKEYYEKFLMGTLLRQLSRKDVRLIESDDQHLADFTLIADETDIFVIEVKSVAQNYRIFESQNVEEFRKYIDKHYLTKAGAPQLKRYIEYIIDDKLKLFNIQRPSKKLNIYPILICTDPKSATYGVNDYVGQQANVMFSAFSDDFNKIMPLTMIQSDFFVENISLLTNDKTMLKKLVRGYHFYHRRKKERCRKLDTTVSFIEAMCSFDQFAFGRYGAFSLAQEEIHYHLEQVFGMHK